MWTQKMWVQIPAAAPTRLSLSASKLKCSIGMSVPWELQLSFISFYFLQGSEQFLEDSGGVYHLVLSQNCGITKLVCVFNCVWLSAIPWTVDHQAPLSRKISKQQYWSGLPFPTPGDLPNPGIEPTPLVYPALGGRAFATRATWEAHNKT